MKKSILLIFFFILTSSYYIFSSEQSIDDLIVDKIHQFLIKEYDNYKDRTFTEKMVLKFGKKAFIDNVRIWKDNYKNLDSMKIVLHPILEKIAVVCDKNLEEDKSKYFRSLLEELTKLGYKNLQIYYTAVKDYLVINNKKIDDINKELIDDAVCLLRYYEEKTKLYEREEIVKNEIRAIMTEKKVKFKLAFYIFAFDFFNKIRKGIIEKDMQRMLEKINQKINSNL